jgi:hypothetical protein
MLSRAPAVSFCVAAKKKKAKRKAKARSKRAKRPSPWTLEAVPMPDIPPPESWSPGWQDRALTLLRVYNEGLRATGWGKRVVAQGRNPAKAWSQSTLHVFYALDVWCRRRRFDPVAWLAHLFAQLAGRHAPPFAALFSEARAEAFVAWSADGHTETGRSAALAKDARQARAFLPFVDLHPGAETMKRTLFERGNHTLCLLSADLTFGYHAQSAICPQCPVRVECSARARQLQREVSR